MDMLGGVWVGRGVGIRRQVVKNGSIPEVPPSPEQVLSP